MDRRIMKTREAIKTSYFQLLKEKPEGRITVAELTRLANIDRKTFYLHYTCVEDILTDFCDEKVQELLDRLKGTGFLEDPLKLNIIFEVLNNILEEDMDYYRLLSLRNYHIFWERIHEIMVQALIHVYSDKVNVSRKEMKIYCDFFVSGMIHIYQDFLNSSDEFSSEQLGRIVLDIARNGVTNLFK